MLGIYNACVLCQGLDGSGPAEPNFPLFLWPRQSIPFSPGSFLQVITATTLQLSTSRISSLETHRNLTVLIDYSSGTSSPMLDRRSRR